MADWWHSVALQMMVAVAAYLGGVLTKPLQNYIETKQKERTLSYALYAEFASNLNLLGRLYHEAEGKKGKFEGLKIPRGFLACGCFEEAANQPTMFNQLREASDFRRLYELLVVFKSFNEVETESVLGICDTVFTAVGGLLAHKRIKAKPLMRLLNPQAKSYVVIAEKTIREKRIRFDPI